jgi:ppGpp synthetase/RelA/SpoT-type nucleotidyltranferase
MRRNVKAIRSIVAKLRRQTTKLVQIQDLIGCRIIIPVIADQDKWTIALSSIFPTAQIVDRRDAPTNGYRGVHLIVRGGLQRFEIQLRTALQERWATIVEKIADKLGLEIKYGAGASDVQSMLQEMSGRIAQYEALEQTWQIRLEQPDGSNDYIMILHAVSEHYSFPMPLKQGMYSCGVRSGFPRGSTLLARDTGTPQRSVPS